MDRRASGLSVHSFTPRFQGVTRDVDVGLLYDPRRPAERALCTEWIALLRARAPELRLRRNQPYRGDSDGLTTHLRGVLGARYLGVELEVSQRFPAGAAARWRALRRLLTSTLADLLA